MGQGGGEEAILMSKASPSFELVTTAVQPGAGVVLPLPLPRRRRARTSSTTTGTTAARPRPWHPPSPPPPPPARGPRVLRYSALEHWPGVCGSEQLSHCLFFIKFHWLGGDFFDGVRGNKQKKGGKRKKNPELSTRVVATGAGSSVGAAAAAAAAERWYKSIELRSNATTCTRYSACSSRCLLLREYEPSGGFVGHHYRGIPVEHRHQEHQQREEN